MRFFFLDTKQRTCDDTIIKLVGAGGGGGAGAGGGGGGIATSVYTLEHFVV